MKLLVLMVISLLAYSTMMGSRVLISLAALKLTDSTMVTGAVIGMYSLLPIFLGLSIGRLIDRFGILRPVFGATIISLAGLVLPFLFPSVWSVAFASAASGIGFTAAAMAMTNAGALLGSAERRTTNLSWLFLSNSAGMGIGPLMAGFGIDHIGHRGTFLLLAALPAVSIVLLLLAGRLVPGGRGSGKPPAGKLLECLREPRLRSVIIPQVLISGSLETFYFIVPLHGTSVGISATTIGVIISCGFVANFATRAAMPVLLRLGSETTLAVVMFVIAAISMAPFGYFSNPAMLMLLAGGVGTCHGVVMPILTSLAFTASPPGRQGEVAGARSVLTYSTIGTSQLLAGTLSGLVGIAPVMWLVAAMALGGGWYMRRHGRAPG